MWKELIVTIATLETQNCLLSCGWRVLPCSSRRRQQGTMVRLGSCWQTMLGPGAISSCFPPQRPSLEVDCTYLFLFYKTDMKDKAFYVCLLWLGLAMWAFKKTPSENQSTGLRLMPDPSGLECWDQLVSLGPLILLAFELDVAWSQPPLSSMHSLSSSHQIWEVAKAKGRMALWVSSLNLKVTALVPWLQPVAPVLALETWPYPMRSPVGNGKASRLQSIRQRD